MNAANHRFSRYREDIIWRSSSKSKFPTSARRKTCAVRALGKAQLKAMHGYWQKIGGIGVK